MARSLGGVEVQATVTLRGAQRKLTADLKRLRGEVQVPLAIATKKATAQLEAWRRLQQRKGIRLNVDVDDRDLVHFERRLSRVEHIYRTSDLRKGIRIQVAVAGAAALPVLAQGALSAAAAITELTRAVAVLPGVFAGVGGIVGTLATGLTGLGDAFSAASKSSKDAVKNTKDYERAARDLQRAQRDVVQALRDANREIEDQRTKLQQGALGVEQARLNVQRANERLARGGFESLTDYQQALLDVKQANLDLSTAIRQQNRDIQDYYDTAGRGVTQSDTFRNALDRLADATDKFSEAQKGALGITDEFTEAMARLSPAAQDFVTKIRSLGPAWEQFRRAVSDRLLQGLGQEIVDLANKRLPMLQTGMERVASSLNASFRTLLDAIGSDRSAQAIASIFDRIAGAVDRAQPGITSLVNAFLTLTEVGSRFLPRLAGAFNRVMGRFENFINRAAEDGSLEDWIDRGLNAFASLGRAIGHIFSIFGSLNRAYETATGNVGGFISTAERGLGRLARWLASPEGQGRLVEYLRSARVFIDAIKEAMPGIIKGFKAFAEGLREAAEWLFPIFARIGSFMSDHIHLTERMVAAWVTFRTVKPIINAFQRVLDGVRNKLAEIRAEQQAALETQQRLATEHQKALDARAQAQRDQAKARINERIVRSQNELALNQAKRQEVLARTRLDMAREEKTLANQAYITNKRIFDDVAKNGERLEMLRKKERDHLATLERMRNRLRYKRMGAVETAAFESAIAKEEQRLGRTRGVIAKLEAERQEALDNTTLALQRKQDAENKVFALEQQHAQARKGITQVQRQNALNLVTAQGDLDKANRTLAASTEEVTRSKGRLADATGRVRTGFGRLVDRIGHAGSTIKGTLIGALKGIAGTLLGIGVGVGVMYAFEEWIKANERAKRNVDAHRQAVESLNATLEEGTGAATAATRKQVIENLRTSKDPYSDETFDATKALQEQAGLSIPQQSELALPTRVEERERALEPSDQQIIAAVPNLDEWKQWGDKFKENGVDETVYGKALNGDPVAVGKVEAARKAIHQQGLGRFIGFGAAVDTGFAPEDLGAAQQQLPENLRNLSRSVGALRREGDANVVAGQQEQQAALAIPGSGPGLGQLNEHAHRTFGFLRPNFTSVQDDGSINIATDVFPEESWIEGVRDRGISVRPRAGGGANITVDSDAAKRFLPPELQFHSGGAVFGRGDIPAMLSNGEFVMRPEAVKHWGLDTMWWMNSAPGFQGGGAVRGGWWNHGSWWDFPKPPKPPALPNLEGMVRVTNARVTEPNADSGIQSDKPSDIEVLWGRRTGSSMPFPGIMRGSTTNPNPLLAPMSRNPWDSTPSGGRPNIPGVDAVASPTPVTPMGLIGELSKRQPKQTPLTNAPKFKPSDTSPPTVKDYLSGAFTQVLNTVGIRGPSVHPALKSRTNLIADAARAVYASVTGRNSNLGFHRVTLLPGEVPFWKGTPINTSNFGGVNTLPVTKPTGQQPQSQAPSGPSIFGPQAKPPGAGTPSAPQGKPPAPKGEPHKGNQHFPVGSAQPGPGGPVATSDTVPVQVPQTGQTTAPGGGIYVPSYEELGPPGMTSAATGPSTAPTQGAVFPTTGAAYVPDFSGPGVITENEKTKKSAVPNAPIHPNANILNYLRQVGKAYALFEGTSTIRPEEPSSQHATGRAIDLGGGSPGWENPVLVEKFVKEWISDPTKVAATRQLIFAAPSGRKYGIINGRLLSDQEAVQVYGTEDPNTLGGHNDHVHLALEGVPLSAFVGGTNQGAPIAPTTTDTTQQQPTTQAPPGSIAGQIPGIPGFGAPIQGPFGPIPFDGQAFLTTLGSEILKAILGFFGIDISPITNAIQQIIGGVGAMQQGQQQNLPQAMDPNVDPGPDQSRVQQLIDMAAEYKAAGNKEMAEQLLQAARDYAQRSATPLPGTEGAVPGSPGGQVIPHLPASGLLPGQTSSTPSSQEQKDANRNLARQMFGKYFPESEWNAFDRLVMKESGYDNWAKNPSSTAFGIGQFLDSTWQAYGWGGDKGAATSDPAVQLDLMLRYIKDRYGTPSQALAFHNANNWYARGGFIRGLRGGGPAKQGPAVDIFGHEGDEDWVSSILDQNYGDLAYDTPMLNAQGGLISKLSGGGHYDDDTWRWAQERMWVYSPWPYLLQNYGGPGGISIGNAAGGFIHRAGGGPVRGPGGPTDDKIPALLSDGEFVMRAAAVKHWGLDRLMAMNKMQHGGPVIDPRLSIFGPTGAGPHPPPPPGAPLQIGPAGAGPHPPLPPGAPLQIGPAGAPPALQAPALGGIGESLGSVAGSFLSPKGAPSGTPNPQQGETSDPRSILGAPPVSENHLHPALRAGIEGAFNTVGSLAGSAVGAAVGAGLAGTPGGQAAAGPASAAASQLVAAGAQIAGQTVSGVANALSSLLVGTVTPSTVGQGSGQPVLPDPSQARSTVNITHNGNIVAYNPEEAFRLKERREAQAAAPFYNRTF